MQLNIQKAAGKIAEQNATLNTLRDTLEGAPLLADDTHTYQFDDRSEKRMRNSIDNWASTLGAQDGNGNILWIDANNNIVPHSQSSLSDLYDELITKRTSRAAALSVYKNTWKAQLPVADSAECFIGASWPT